MNILCKMWDVAVTVAAFYYVAKLMKDFQGKIPIFFIFLRKWLADACLIVNTYLVKEN